MEKLIDSIERFKKKQLHDARNIACAKGFTIFSVLSYLYFITNDLNNHDNIAYFDTGYGNGANLGRWFLQVLGEAMKALELDYNIPFFNVLIALVFLLLSAVLIVHILKIENPKLCFGLGAITASFPVIAATVFYTFTIHYYGFAILLGILGVYLAHRKKRYSLLAPILFCLSLGIYQAYFPLFASLLVLVLIQNTLDEAVDWKAVVKDAFFYLLLLFVGIFLYLKLNQLFLSVFHTALSDYQGISCMGYITIRELVHLVFQTYRDTGLLFTNGYHGISTMKILRVALAANFLFVLLCVILDWKNRKLMKNLELCVLLLILPVAANSIVIMVPYGFFHILMLLGLLSLFYLPLVMAQNLKCSAAMKKAAVVFVCFITLVSSLTYAYQANGNYRSMYYKNRKMENYYATLIGQIRAVEGFTEDMEIVLTGYGFHDDSLHDNMDDPILRYTAANPNLRFSLEADSKHQFIYQYFGYMTRNATEEELLDYASIIDEMNTYPISGSIRVIDNKIFVKCD